MSRRRNILLGLAAGGITILAYRYLARCRARRVIDLVRLYKVEVCGTRAAVEGWLRRSGIVAQDGTLRQCVVGFDMEWAPGGRASLVQIATSQCCALIRLPACVEGSRNSFADSVGESLISVLEDETVLKVGVAIGADGKKLKSDWGVALQGFTELKSLASGTAYSQVHGLKALGKALIGYEYGGLIDVRRSTWDTSTLSAAQIDYAAADAIVSYQVARACWDGVNAATVTPFQERDDNFRAFVGSAKGSVPRAVPQAKQPAQRPPPLKKSARKIRGNLYHNIPIYNVDGAFLGYCRKSLIAHQLVKLHCEAHHGERGPGIRTMVQYDPMDEFHRIPKENQCVVCASRTQLTKHHIVPNRYACILDRADKVHDICVLCLACATNVDDAYVREYEVMAQEYGVPLGGENDTNAIRTSLPFQSKMYSRTLCKLAASLSKNIENSEGDSVEVPEEENDADFLVEVKEISRLFKQIPVSARRSRVLVFINTIPKEKLEKMVQLIATYVGVGAEDLTVEDIYSRCLLKREPNLKFRSHAEAVVTRVRQEGSEQQFLERWRRFFVQAANPRHMGEGWHIEYCGPTNNRLLDLLRLIMGGKPHDQED